MDQATINNIATYEMMSSLVTFIAFACVIYVCASDEYAYRLNNAVRLIAIIASFLLCLCSVNCFLYAWICPEKTAARHGKPFVEIRDAHRR